MANLRERIPSLAFLAILSAAPVPAAIVHEWGTFTSLATSGGQPLEGLFVDATRLPGFVHGLPFFNYGAAGWPSPDKLRGVTVKMETPVLYFYSKTEYQVSVEVGFKGGTISQWFPQRHAGEADPAGPVVDLGEEPYEGGIEWKAKVLAPNVGAVTHARDESPETREWRAPRLPASNLIEGESGEIEKFLFYRGLGNFPMALGLRFDADGKLAIRNTGPDSIPYVVVYHQAKAEPSDVPPEIWWSGALAPGEAKSVPAPEGGDYGISGMAMQGLFDAMVSQGLYHDEARALFDTWYNGYFAEVGFKAFWIVPRKQVDRLLPLRITPAPDSLVRVIVGRSEILTPKSEAGLIAEGGTLPSRAQDKYYLAYRDFLEHWSAQQSTPVTQRVRVAGSRRPWSLVLPWEGPYSSPVLSPGRGSPGRGSPGRGSPGRGVAADLLGRAVVPAGPVSGKLR